MQTCQEEDARCVVWPRAVGVSLRWVIKKERKKPHLQLIGLFVLPTCNNQGAKRFSGQTFDVSVWCSLIEHVFCCLCKQPSHSTLSKHGKGEEEIRCRLMSSPLASVNFFFFLILTRPQDYVLSRSCPSPSLPPLCAVNHDNIQLPVCKV